MNRKFTSAPAVRQRIPHGSRFLSYKATRNFPVKREKGLFLLHLCTSNNLLIVVCTRRRTRPLLCGCWRVSSCAGYFPHANQDRVSLQDQHRVLLTCSRLRVAAACSEISIWMARGIVLHTFWLLASVPADKVTWHPSMSSYPNSLCHSHLRV